MGRSSLKETRSDNYLFCVYRPKLSFTKTGALSRSFSSTPRERTNWTGFQRTNWRSRCHGKMWNQRYRTPFPSKDWPIGTSSLTGIMVAAMLIPAGCVLPHFLVNGKSVMEKTLCCTASWLYTPTGTLKVSILTLQINSQSRKRKLNKTATLFLW